MSRHIGALTLLAVSILTLAGGWAQNEKRVTIELKEAPIADAFDQLFRAAGENFILQPSVLMAQRLTMRLTEVPFEKALNFLCDLAGLRWERKNGVYLISPRTPAGAAVGGAFFVQPSISLPRMAVGPAEVPGAPVRTPFGLQPFNICPRCRQVVTRSCPKCRRAMEFYWHFCPFDGAKLPPAPTKCPKCGTLLPKVPDPFAPSRKPPIAE